MSRFQDLILQGIRADQPLATDVAVGTLYGVTDEDDIIERSDGSAWQPYSPSAASTQNFLQLAQIVTVASQATIDFTSLSGAYSALKVQWTIQTNTAGTGGTDFFQKVNNDGTAGNYTTTRILLAGAAVATSAQASSTSGQIVGYAPNAGNTSFASTGELTLPTYAGTTFHKRWFSIVAHEDGTAIYTAEMSGRWKSTAAITRLTYSVPGGTFLNGSVVTVYGLL